MTFKNLYRAPYVLLIRFPLFLISILLMVIGDLGTAMHTWLYDNTKGFE